MVVSRLSRINGFRFIYFFFYFIFFKSIFEQFVYAAGEPSLFCICYSECSVLKSLFGLVLKLDALVYYDACYEIVY